MSNFTPTEAQALQQFEDAHNEDEKGCIGHTRRRMNRRVLAAAYKRVVALGLERALTPREDAAGRGAVAWVKEDDAS